MKWKGGPAGADRSYGGRFSSRLAPQRLRSPAEQSPNDTEHQMAITLYSGFVPVCLQLLSGLKGVLQKTEEHATAQKWDTAVVLNLRLYPDMFTLERQVRQVCTHSSGAGRVAGVALPSFPDQDNSFAEMQARIDKTVDFLKGLRADQIDGKEDTVITVPMGGQPREFKCQNYLYHFAMLQVQFHATTAYDIVRSTGVNIAKRDYLGPMPS
jgi:uncharacterized protein